MSSDWLSSYLQQQVVIDLSNDYLVYGVLVLVSADHLEVERADLHDHGEANSSKEVYTVESSKLGVRENRRRVAIPREKMLAISLLDDVIG